MRKEEKSQRQRLGEEMLASIRRRARQIREIWGDDSPYKADSRLVRLRT